MEKKQVSPYIPYDMFQSPQEIVIIMPLWGIQKESLKLSINDYKLDIRWERNKQILKEDFVPLKEECYRWPITQQIDLPSQVYFDKIHSKLSADNILTIIIPKAIIPESIQLSIE